jgi:hypothetical protein
VPQAFESFGTLSAAKRFDLLESTGVRITWSAGWNRQHADSAGDHLVLCGSIGGLGGGGHTGEDKDDDESADDVFHSWIPQKLYLLKKDFAGQTQ